MRHIIFFFVVLFSLSFQEVLAQSNDYQFDTFLKDQAILDIETDSLKQLFIQAQDTSYLYDNRNFLIVDRIPATDSTLMMQLNAALKKEDEYMLHNTITTATSMIDGRVIFTNDSGIIYQLYNGAVQRYLMPEYDPDKIIVNKLVSRNDMLIICTLNDGAYVWRPSEFRMDKINNSTGLLDNNINDAHLDQWGNLWLATNWGLKRLNYINQENTSKPIVYIEQMNVMYDEYEFRDAGIIALSKTENNIQFHFNHVDYSSNSEIQYEWKLNEASGWQATDENMLSLTNLDPGAYSFQLRASNGNGMYGYAEPVDLKISSNLSDTIWPYVLAGLGLLSLLWIWSLLRYNKSKEAYDKERKKLILENQLLKTEQKALQLQMNPHFIFNALNSIQGLIVLNDTKGARNYLNKFSRMMRTTLNQSREESVTIKDEIKYLEDYLSLEQLSRGNKFDFEVNSPDELLALEIPSMLIQPFVENSIVHGMAGLDRQVLISITFEETSLGLTCVVEDNGVGRKVASSSNHKSIALQVVKERLEKYHKIKSAKSMEIIDKKDENGSALGTSTKILLPTL